MFTLERNSNTSKREKSKLDLIDDLKDRTSASSQSWSPGMSVLATALIRSQK